MYDPNNGDSKATVSLNRMTDQASTVSRVTDEVDINAVEYVLDSK